MNREEFFKAFNTWLQGAQAIIDDYMEERFPALQKPRLIYTEGDRYIRVIRQEGLNSGLHGSAHAFIDKTNGDVLKPSSWKTPAKHARGNIFNVQNPTKGMGPYDPTYLR